VGKRFQALRQPAAPLFPLEILRPKISFFTLAPIRACTRRQAGNHNALLLGECDMFDFTPLYRSSIGFDHLARMLDEAATFETPTYPPYNIERVGDDEYLISVAIAGFTSDDVNIEVKGNDLTITGKKNDKPEGRKEYLHQGIAGRNFQRTFQLADHVEVKSAELNEGLLQISLQRVIPEALKPRTIAVRSGNEQKTIESKKAA
jgi:molecular chaperone IbpA